ncbi:hypothetical protein SNEBB_005993 [Seison nebaliae]|nr:hypothetical protein SNEBB_005993 [Seison nebaliae]
MFKTIILLSIFGVLLGQSYSQQQYPAQYPPPYPYQYQYQYPQQQPQQFDVMKIINYLQQNKQALQKLQEVLGLRRPITAPPKRRTTGKPPRYDFYNGQYTTMEDYDYLMYSSTPFPLRK